MTEEEAEDGVAVEVIDPSIQLMKITRESNLDPDLANEFLINFEEHFKMANEWSKKAKLMIVTNDNQTVLMEQARVARLFIRGKRLEIENFRKSKKEYYLRGGQAIDKVCTFLKNMIEPIENHLDLQEHYIEYKKKAEEARLLAEVQAKMEADRIAKEEADRKALALAQAENEKLRKEQADRDKLEAEKKRIAQEAYDKEMAIIRKENEAKLLKERQEREKAESELRAKKQAEAKAEADKIRAEEALLNAGDSEKLQAFRAAVLSIRIPEVKSSINKRIILDAQSHLYLAVSKITIQEEE